MADGGFAVKFDSKVAKLCYSVAFDYDEWQVKFNDGKPEPLPKGLKSITITMEKGR